MSSHDPVLTNLVLPAAAQVCSKEKYSYTYQDFLQSKVIWEEEKIGDYQNLTTKILSGYESYFPTPEFIPLKCQLYSELLGKAAECPLTPDPVNQLRRPSILHSFTRLGNTFRKHSIPGKKEGKPRYSGNPAFLK